MNGRCADDDVAPISGADLFKEFLFKKASTSMEDMEEFSKLVNRVAENEMDPIKPLMNSDGAYPPSSCFARDVESFKELSTPKVISLLNFYDLPFHKDEDLMFLRKRVAQHLGLFRLYFLH